MFISQKCVCFPENIPAELIDNFITSMNLNSNTTSIVDDIPVNNSSLESIMIFGIILLMIIVFFVISKCLKRNTINPYSKNNESNDLNISEDSTSI